VFTSHTRWATHPRRQRIKHGPDSGDHVRRGSCSAERRDRPVHPRPAQAHRLKSRPARGCALRPRPSRCPTPALVEATRHPRHRQPPTRAPLLGAAAGRPCQHLGGISIHPLQAHSRSCRLTACHRVRKDDRRHVSPRLWTIGVVLPSLRHGPSRWRSHVVTVAWFGEPARSDPMDDRLMQGGKACLF
jgi:hypothetical protein